MNYKKVIKETNVDIFLEKYNTEIKELTDEGNEILSENINTVYKDGKPTYIGSIMYSKTK